MDRSRLDDAYTALNAKQNARKLVEARLYRARAAVLEAEADYAVARDEERAAHGAVNVEVERMHVEGMRAAGVHCACLLCNGGRVAVVEAQAEPKGAN